MHVRSEWVIALLGAFGGAAVGAALGGWFTFRERVRSSRSQIYSRLVAFHDDANDLRRRVAESGEPVATGAALRERFRTVDAEAAVASRFDREAVRALWAMLDRVEEASTEYARRGDTPNADAVALARSLAAVQASRWDGLVDYVWDYRRWLEWKASKRWWSFRYRSTPRPITADEAGRPPKVLRSTASRNALEPPAGP